MIQELGDLFGKNEIFLPELILGAEAMKEGLKILEPELQKRKKELKKLGKIILGTVEGDIHDIGKNLVKMMLESNGFKVIDLGVDISADCFVEATRGNSPDIVAMSGLLTTTITYFPTVIKAFKKAGLRSKVKIMVGGASVSREYADEIGAEGFAMDCVSAVDEAFRLMTLK